MSWPTKFVFFAHCTTLWKWGHPSCSKLIRLNFTCCHRFTSQNTLGGSLSKVSVMTFAVCSGYMESAGSILNSGHFRHQSFGGSLQQCSASILNAGVRLFFSPPAWLCSTCAPTWTLRSFIPWHKIKSCVHLILTMNPSSQGGYFLVLSTLDFEHGFSPWLACICPCEIHQCSNCWISKNPHHGATFAVGGSAARGCLYQSPFVCIMQVSLADSWECHFLHVQSACSAATEISLQSLRLSSLYSVTPGRMPPPAGPSQSLRHSQ